MESIAHIIAITAASAAEAAKIKIHHFYFPPKLNKLSYAVRDSNRIFSKLADSYIFDIVWLTV
jgi:hypothetical protein